MDSVNRFAQWVFYRRLRRMPHSLLQKVEQKLLDRIRNRLISFGDPLVHYQFDGTELILPLSHNLPEFRRQWPEYSSNIGRIAEQLLADYPSLSVIDIGSNIGDTVAILRKSADFPILSIEGDERFYSLLKHNVSHLRGVSLDYVLIGDTEGDFTGSIHSTGGTAHVVGHDDSHQSLRFETLESVLKRHPQFAYSKLIKIDTDGMDTRILRGSLAWITHAKPVIFFEYDPFFFRQAHDDGFQIFAALRERDYQLAMFFENTGDYLLTISIDNTDVLEDLHAFYSGRKGMRYCDICVFHKEDIRLGNRIRQKEIGFIKKLRPT